MNRIALGWLVAAALLWSALLPALAAQEVPLDPRVRVGFPSEPPPPLPATPALANPAVTGPVDTVQIPLQQGWNVISFPLASVRTAQGFSHHLYYVAASRYLAVDPAHDPASLDPGRAYLAWADQPVTVQVQGEPNRGQTFTTRLYPGWNMLGCPSTSPLPLDRTSLTFPGGTTLAFRDALNPSPTPGQGWLYSGGRQFSGGKMEDVDLRTPGLALAPGRVVGLFCWADCQVNWNLASQQAAPRLDKVDPNPIQPGQVVTLQGSGFGQKGAGAVTVEGRPVHPDRVISWSDRQIVAHVPNGVQPGTSGNVSVLVNRVPSNAIPVKVIPADSSAGASLAPPAGGGSSGVLQGRVESSSGSPLANAQVWLDEGEFAASGRDGSFRFDGVAPGRYTVFVSLPGYRTGQGEVQIKPGETRKMKVSLSPADGSGPAPEKKSTLTVKARVYDAGGKRWWPQKIDVYELGNTNSHWTKSWWTDVGDSYVELPCPGVLVGRTYTVYVKWVDPAGTARVGKWEPKIWKADQRETYEHP